MVRSTRQRCWCLVAGALSLSLAVSAFLPQQVRIESNANQEIEVRLLTLANADPKLDRSLDLDSNFAFAISFFRRRNQPTDDREDWAPLNLDPTDFDITVRGAGTGEQFTLRPVLIQKAESNRYRVAFQKSQLLKTRKEVAVIIQGGKLLEKYDYVLHFKTSELLAEPISDTSEKKRFQLVGVKVEKADAGGHRTAEHDLQLPELVRRTNLVYTDAALEAESTGNVVLEITVRKDGSPADFRVLKGFGHGLEERAIREIAANWLFRPGRLNGKPVAMRVKIELEFSVK